ncbi:M20/M25/M40 family metallo-hydrolase [Myxococcus sp. K15C18031901]|uniref:M20/M25/M40 family metallo-hydrolase n=1 Tax=Myxococcus dinghuensis TaxID=2906761 RepID=UPI0020A7A49D|nr:M20/M25/M40 family metallo-hydrolase [Myxococcus dinghuensis]MCP3102380.1 M20/M25/M40 family metallo-hydrolase [Myxococcus dinghuensis]
MKRLIPFAMLLLSPTPVLAGANDPALWITIDSEAVKPVSEAFAREGWAAPTPYLEKHDVTLLPVYESQLERIAQVMHDRFNRCAGFVTYETFQEAMASLTPPDMPAAAELTVPSYTLDSATTVNKLIAVLAESNIRSTINTMSAYTTRYYTSTTGVSSANWLRTHWASLGAGRSDVTVELFNHAAWAQPSVILTIQGTTLPNQVVVVGGHLDSTSSGSTAPGADDNASGIASFTEVIRAAMAVGYRPARTVKFIGYAAEEVGLRGSKEIAAYFKNNGVDVVGVLQLDMTNYPSTRSDVKVGVVTDYTNAAQNTFLRNLITTYVGIKQANSTCGYACSDHASWYNQGFAASIPHEALVPEGNPYIHTVNDTIARSGSTANHALHFAKIAAAFVAELGEGSAP